MMAVYLYFRFKLSLDDVVELMSWRGFSLSHQTVSNWVHRFGTSLGMQLRKVRRGKAKTKWHVDATYIKSEGRWCYFYRAIDKDGNLVDVYLSDKRNINAAENFFKQAMKTTGIKPSQITTDKEPAFYRAVKNIFGKNTKHRDSKYMNNLIEQHHRGIKSRYKVMKGFKNIFSTLRFCTVFEEIQQFFRIKNKSRSKKRNLIAPRIREFNNLIFKTA